MLSKTLDEGLQRYAIGPKLRALRLKKKLGLAELAEHTGLSPSLLSKLERGKLYPTLPTLMRIALVFGVALDHFFVQPRQRVAVVRHDERQRFPDNPDEPSFMFECLDYEATGKRLSAYLAEFLVEQDEPLTRHEHPGVEFIHVISGSLELSVEEEQHTLEAGDSAYFESDLPHGYRRAGTDPCRALVVTAP